MSAQILRDAAKTLRQRSDWAGPGPWAAVTRPDGRCWIDMPDLDGHAFGLHGFPAATNFIAMLNPVVGLSIADVLDALATDVETLESAEGRTLNDSTLDMNLSAYPECIALAGLILGGAS